MGTYSLAVFTVAGVRDVILVVLLLPVFALRLLHYLWTRIIAVDKAAAADVDMFAKEFAEHISLVEIRPGRKVAVLHMRPVERHGRGTIIFVHGACARMQQFEHQIRFFARKGFEVVAYDALGCSLSEKPDSPRLYASSALNDDMHAIVDRYTSKLTKCLIVGHSMGGAMVNRSVSSNEWLGRVAGGVVVCPPYIKSAEAFRARVYLLTLPRPLVWLLRPLFARKAASVLFGPNVSPSLVAQEREASARNPVYMFRAFYGGVRPEMFLFGKMDRELKIPCLFLGARFDKLCPVSGVEKYVEFFKNPGEGLLKVCETSGHQVMQEDPDWVNTEIHNFFITL